MTADDLMRLINRYVEACDDLGEGLFEKPLTTTDDLHAKATALHKQILDEVYRLHAAQPQAPSVPADERAAFEAWAESENFNVLRDGSDKYRNYHIATTRWAWDAWQARAAAPVGLDANAAAPGWQWVPKEPTPEMVTAYLAANHVYWKEMDEGPAPIGKWRNGTPAEATAESYAAMLAAAPQAQAAPAAPADEIGRLLTSLAHVERLAVSAIRMSPKSWADLIEEIGYLGKLAKDALDESGRAPPLLAPAARPELTDERIYEINSECADPIPCFDVLPFARAIESELAGTAAPVAEPAAKE